MKVNSAIATPIPSFFLLTPYWTIWALISHFAMSVGLAQVNSMNPEDAPYISLIDEANALEVYRQFTEVEWKEARRDGESVSYWSDPIDPCPVYGYLRSSFLDHVEIEQILRAHLQFSSEFLTFINKKSFQQTETLKVFHESKDRYHALVRTFYKLPLMKNREYLHHVYLKKMDDKTYVIAIRDPGIDEEGIPPVQKGYIRASMYPSGQLIRETDDGRIQLDHMIHSTLNGRWKAGLTNRLLKKPQLKVYLEEAILAKVFFEEQRP